jgi:hypothetical protein
MVYPGEASMPGDAGGDRAERCTALYGVPTMFIADARPSAIRELRPDLAAHRHHGRLALPDRGDDAVSSEMHMPRSRSPTA